MQRETIKASRDKSQINYNRKNNSETNAILSSKTWFFVPKWPTWRPFGTETWLSLWSVDSIIYPQPQCDSTQEYCQPRKLTSTSVSSFHLRLHYLWMIYWNTHYTAEFNLQILPLPRLPGSKPQSSNHMVGISGMDSPVWVTSLAQII